MKPKYLAVAILSTLAITGCSKQAVDKLELIGPSDTAFLVSLEGDTKKDQAKLKSIDFLNANKISAKRILIPHKIVDTCPSCLVSSSEQLVDVATAQLFTIRHTPVTRDWTASATKGTSKNNEAFSVESVESIDFDIGATITAHVKEDDAAAFLYYYSGKQLEEIIDTNVRSYIGTVLAEEFGGRTYDKARSDKVAIFAIARTKSQAFFAERGITIDNLGYTDGMTPHDVRIQDAINKKFEADIAVGIAEQQMQAAKKIAEASEAMKVKQDLESRAKQVDMGIIMANKWDGHGIMPQFVVTSDGRIVTSVPVDTSTKK